MSEQLFHELRRRYQEIQQALDGAESGEAAGPGEVGARERVREEIVSLFRDTERLIEQLSEFREEIRPLVDRYKAAFRRAAAAPESGSTPVRLDHLGASTYLERGWSAIAGANYPLAVKEIGRALELAPGTARGEVLLAWALMRLDRLEEARRLLEGVLEREPGNELARANLGYVDLRESRFAEAIEHLARAQRAGTDRTAELYAHLYMGMVYAEREMYRDARAMLSRALELGPNLVEAHWEMGRTHYLEGDTESALRAWTLGAETNRFNPWGERCGEAAAQLRDGAAVSLA